MTGRGETVDVVAAAAHELKAPLVVIRWLALSLGDRQLQLSPKEQQDYLDRVVISADRMLRLTNQLTLSSRFETAGQLDFMHTLEPVNLDTLCEAALHELSLFASKQGRQLRLIKRRRQVVLANRDILHDIVVNLVDNALRHGTQVGCVDVSAKTVGDKVRLFVKDDGPGIAPEDMRALRATLGQQPQPISGRSGTSGLGLYVAGKLAESMGGSLGLGRPKRGALFFVELLRSHQLKLAL